MAGFASLIAQKRPVRILTSYLEKHIFPPALLFTGCEGVGKYAAAITFAKACNCDGYLPNDDRAAADPADGDPVPCGHCRSCRRIQSGHHPDVITVRPSGQQLRVDQIRSLLDTLSLKPYEARRRLVVILNAEAMNPEAGNAFLKTLEEPPPDTVLILCAPQAADLLPTIASRCQHIQFNPLTPAGIIRQLQDRSGLDEKSAAVIAAMADGKIGKALQLVDADWRTHRQWVLTCSGLLDPPSGPSCRLRSRLALAERLARDKNKATAALEMMATWLRDLLVYPFAPTKVINIDLKREIQYTVQHTQPSCLLEQLAVIQSAQRDLQSNANFRLVMDRAMIRLATD